MWEGTSSMTTGKRKQKESKSKGERILQSSLSPTLLEGNSQRPLTTVLFEDIVVDRRDTPLDISILENCAANRMLRVRAAHASSSGRSSRRYTYIHARGPPRARANTRVCVCVAISSKLQYKEEIECNDEREKMRILLEFLFLYLIRIE